MSSIQAGDVVVCVDDTPCPVYGPAPLRKGRVYRVVAAEYFQDANTGAAAYRVQTDRDLHVVHGVTGWYAHDRFRKIEADDKDFIAQIKACRPKQDRVPHNVESDRG